MEHSISPKIADTYEPKAEDIYTLLKWHRRQSIKVTGYLLSYEALFPLFVLVTSLLAILYFLYVKPHALENRINTLANSATDEGFEMRSNLYVITSMSIMSSVYAIIMSAYYRGKGHPCT